MTAHLTKPIRAIHFLVLAFLMTIGSQVSAATNAETIQYIFDKHEAECVAEQYEVLNAKERGVYKNRKRKSVIDRDEVRKLKAEGLSTYKIADQMGISRMSVHRILNNAA